MNPDVLADIQRRLVALEKTTVRYRAGEITDTSPLDVALGGSTVPFEDVRSVNGGLLTGDQVATLVFGNDLVVLGRLLAGEPEDWTNVAAFTNSWVNFDASHPARYYRHEGRVYLEGIIKSGTMNVAAFTLPAGYRPQSGTNDPLNFTIPSNGAYGQVELASAGTVTPRIGTNANFDLAGISFRHA